MEFYQTVATLNAPEHDRVLAHKRLDIYLREHFLGSSRGSEETNIAQLMAPYAFHLLGQTPERSVIMLRSTAALNLPGEKRHHISLEKGDEIDISVLLCSHSKAAEANKFLVNDPDYIRHHISNRLKKAGFECVNKDPASLMVGSPVRYLMKKTDNKKGRAYSLFGYKLSGLVRVIDESLAEKHFVEGIGNKRAYGFGLMMKKDRN